MRVAVEVLVPLRLFVCCFLSQHRINLLLALGAVAHLNLNFSKKFRLEVHIMAYNKAREEKKWRLWKEAEEKQLRSLGVNEDDIEKLRVHDGRFLIQTDGIISECRKQVHILTSLLKILHSPKSKRLRIFWTVSKISTSIKF